MNPTLALKVKHLSKQYRIGERQSYLTFRDSLANWWRRSQSPHSDSPNTYWALRNLTFTVKKGEVLGIVGRNGAGKSTLLKILSRITQPTTGTIWLRGKITSLLEVGTGFSPELTGRENIYLNGAILGMSRQQLNQEFDRIVEFAGIHDFIDTPVKRYSSGMYVRLAFAVAAHLYADILIVDEVLAVGDSAFQKKCLGKMDQIARSGRTVIFVSHQLDAVARLCNRCLLLDQGQLVASGKPQKIINRYLQQLEALSDQDLATRTDRIGKGLVRFTDTWVEDKTGHRTRTVECGEAVTLVARYQAETSEPLVDAQVGLALTTANNQRITDLGNYYTGQPLPSPLPPTGMVRCHIPKLPLNAGLYFYNVIIRSNLHIQDWVMQAGQLEVVGSDYFGTGRPMPENQGVIFIDQQWSLES